MDKYRKKNGKKNLIVLFIMLGFALIGLICLLIGFGSEALVWMRTFGITILILVSPIVIFISYIEINRKIKGM